MTEPTTSLREPAFTPRQQEQLKLLTDALTDAAAQYVRASVDGLSQYVNRVVALLQHDVLRLEALERLLVAKGLLAPEELRDALAALEAERMVDRALDPPGEAPDAGAEDDADEEGR